MNNLGVKLLKLVSGEVALGREVARVEGAPPCPWQEVEYADLLTIQVMPGPNGGAPRAILVPFFMPIANERGRVRGIHVMTVLDPPDEDMARQYMHAVTGVVVPGARHTGGGGPLFRG